MCLFAAVGLLAPRLILVLMWLLNSAFILQPFEGVGGPTPCFRLRDWSFFQQQHWASVGQQHLLVVYRHLAGC